MPLPDLSKIGSDRAANTASEALEKAAGTYADPVEKLSVEERLGLNVYPRGTDPAPYKGAK